MEQREEIETESGVQAACSSSNALAHDERLTIHRLSCPQAVLGDLHILQERARQIQIAMETRNVILGGQTAKQERGDQMTRTLEPNGIRIRRRISDPNSEFA